MRTTEGEFAKRIGIHPPTLSRMLRGSVTNPVRLPVEDGEHWADLLGLKGADRREFLVAMGMEVASPALRDHVLELRRQVEALRNQVADAEGRLRIARDALSGDPGPHPPDRS